MVQDETAESSRTSTCPPASLPEDDVALAFRTATFALLKLYTRQLTSSPLRTKALTAGCLAALADSLVPRSLSRKQELARRFRFFLFGCLWSGPSMHFWQRHVERRFAADKHSAGVTALRKVVFDQLIYGPAANLAFLSFLTLSVERRSVRELLAKIQSTFVSVQLRAWRFWPVVALLNYQAVKPQFRPLVAGGASLAWTLALVSSQPR
jgi:peroxisomal membrane protein 2